MKELDMLILHRNSQDILPQVEPVTSPLSPLSRRGTFRALCGLGAVALMPMESQASATTTLTPMSVDAALSVMSSDSINTMLSEGMLVVGPHGDGAIRRGRSVAFITGVMNLMVWKRDHGLVEVTLDTIMDALGLDAILEFGSDISLPATVRRSVLAYVDSLPGYKDKLPLARQCQTTIDQHEYMEFIVKRPLHLLRQPMPGLGQAMLDGQVEWEALECMHFIQPDIRDRNTLLQYA